MTTITQPGPRVSGFSAARQDDIGYCVLADLSNPPTDPWLRLFAARCEAVFSRHTSPDIRWVENKIWFRVPSPDLVGEYARLIVEAATGASADYDEEQRREAERADELARKSHDLDDLLNQVNAALPEWAEVGDLASQGKATG
ncbi:hypothetical protein [Luteibacter sp. dw_328]|jgi:hypothetical protein|uniref:hypothetical protein n=1 Tax=Luteibacter sp. dw_328 TaxID=2719796 RepID=UPI001BD4CF77|nr:hypothetical protein [Luteibacter sp. dw_328]